MKSLDQKLFFRAYKHTVFLLTHAKQTETFSDRDHPGSGPFHWRAPVHEIKWKISVVQIIARVPPFILHAGGPEERGQSSFPIFG